MTLIMTDYFPRELALAAREALAEMPVVAVTGMRQTGKSTFLCLDPAFTDRRYVTFDDFAQLAAAKADPEGFVNTEEPITIDEAHKCPEILTAIKARVDKKRRPGQFLLSGSANFPMLKHITESLAGRAIYFTMRPFTRREMAGDIRKPPFLRTFLEKGAVPRATEVTPVKLDEILTGGMPSVCLGEVKNQELWFKGFEQTYLERDVRELSVIGNLTAFRDLLRLCALRTGQLLNVSQIGRDARLNVDTASHYLSLLEASFIVFRLAPYLRNRASRLIKSPKLFLSDSGLARWLAGIKDFKEGASEALKGAMFETWAAQNLAGIIDARWPEAELFFWNVQGRHEVDFVIEAGGKCLALEVKSGARWNDRDLSGLKAFLTATPHCQAAIIAHNGSDTVKLGEKIWAMPIGMVLS